jgi:hypothetical protein
MVKLLVERALLKEVTINTPYGNQIISGYFELIVFSTPISNLNLVLNPQ